VLLFIFSIKELFTMSDIQYRARFTNRNDVNLDGLYSLDLPDGTYKMIGRGFITEDQQKLGLRGRAYHYGEFAKKKKQEENQTKNLCKKSVSATKKKTTTKSKLKKVASGKKTKKLVRSTSRKSR
jgi:hypothetical protein